MMDFEKQYQKLVFDNKTGSWRLKSWNSLVHAIILSLNWLLLFEHFSAGGVPL